MNLLCRKKHLSLEALLKGSWSQFSHHNQSTLSSLWTDLHYLYKSITKIQFVFNSKQFHF